MVRPISHFDSKRNVSHQPDDLNRDNGGDMGQEELRPKIQGIVEVECAGPAPEDISVGTM